jgi:hypothetical protein
VQDAVWGEAPQQHDVELGSADERDGVHREDQPELLLGEPELLLQDE